MRTTHVLGALITTDGQHPAGFVDTLDILTDVLKITKLTKVETQAQVSKLIDQGKQFAKQTCGELINISKRDPLMTISENNSVMEAVHKLARTHRLLLTQENGEILHVVAQMDIIRLLLSRHVFVGSGADRPFPQIGLVAESEVGSMDEDLNVVAALRYMRDCMVSGIAITNKKGAIVTNFSATDLLGLTAENFDLLALPVKEFIVKLHGYLRPPVVGTRLDSLETIMMKMNLHGVHRVYITDDALRPIGFLSTSTIMEFLSQAARSKV